MKEKLVDKLRWHLFKPLQWTQADVVYVLVQVRKLLEPYKKTESHPYPSLRMHCDWIVHTELSGCEATKLVKEMDGYFVLVQPELERDRFE